MKLLHFNPVPEEVEFFETFKLDPNLMNLEISCPLDLGDLQLPSTGYLEAHGVYSFNRLKRAGESFLLCGPKSVYSFTLPRLHALSQPAGVLLDCCAAEGGAVAWLLEGGRLVNGDSVIKVDPSATLVDFVGGRYIITCFPDKRTVRLLIPELSVSLDLPENPRHITAADGYLLVAVAADEGSSIIHRVNLETGAVEAVSVPYRVITTFGSALGFEYLADTVATVTVSHTATLPALGYIAASRPHAKYLGISRELAVVADNCGVVSVFQLPREGVRTIQAASYAAQDHDLQSTILGIQIDGDRVLVLLNTGLYVYKLAYC